MSSIPFDQIQQLAPAAQVIAIVCATFLAAWFAYLMYRAWAVFCGHD